MTRDDMVLSYAAAGLRVHPLHWRRDTGSCSCGRACGRNAAKHPLLRHGKDEATADAATVSGWLRRWPDANWGVVPPAGIVVVDVDPRNGGDDALDELQRKFGQLPTTLSARTGSGGWHHWFAYRGPTRGALAPGVDVKTSSGYVVVEPSVHITGGRYQWINPDQISVAAPAWFRTIFDPPRPPRSVGARPRGDGGSAGLLRFVAEAEEGERNRRLYWAAIRAHEQGLDVEPLIDAAVSRGLSPYGARRTVESAAKPPPRKGARSQ